MTRCGALSGGWGNPEQQPSESLGRRSHEAPQAGRILTSFIKEMTENFPSHIQTANKGASTTHQKNEAGRRAPRLRTPAGRGGNKLLTGVGISAAMMRSVIPQRQTVRADERCLNFWQF